MAYSYGTQNGPALGLSAPGLPRKAIAVAVGDTLGFPAKFMIVRASQAIRVPDWATYARLGATGKAGNTMNTNRTQYYGSCGGGFAGTNIIKATPGTLINVRFDPAGTIIDGLGYLLVGGNAGDATTASAGAPGVGTGGDLNFTGGLGAAPPGAGNPAAGGAAAGRGGNGGNAAGSVGGNGSPGVGYLSGSSGGSGVTPGTGGTFTTSATLGTVAATIGLPGTTGGAQNGNAGADGGAGASSGLLAGTPTVTQGGAGFALIEFW